MVASLVSVALALVGASRTLDKCYDCKFVTNGHSETAGLAGWT